MYIKAFIHPSLHTGLEGTTVPVGVNLHYLNIMKLCCIKSKLLHPDLPNCMRNSYNFSVGLTDSGVGGSLIVVGIEIAYV